MQATLACFDTLPRRPNPVKTDASKIRPGPVARGFAPHPTCAQGLRTPRPPRRRAAASGLPQRPFLPIPDRRKVGSRRTATHPGALLSVRCANGAPLRRQRIGKTSHRWRQQRASGRAVRRGAVSGPGNPVRHRTGFTGPWSSRKVVSSRMAVPRGRPSSSGVMCGSWFGMGGATSGFPTPSHRKALGTCWA